VGNTHAAAADEVLVITQHLTYFNWGLLGSRQNGIFRICCFPIHLWLSCGLFIYTSVCVGEFFCTRSYPQFCIASLGLQNEHSGESVCGIRGTCTGHLLTVLLCRYLQSRALSRSTPLVEQCIITLSRTIYPQSEGRPSSRHHI
jgi:hypothetical protein